MLFGLEFVVLGRLEYQALVPALMASLVGDYTTRAFGIAHTDYPQVPALAMSPLVAAKWFVFALLIHWFAPSLNQIKFFGWPLGYYMAAQGSLIIFVVQLFLFSRQQHAIDVKYGVAEDDE